MTGTDTGLSLTRADLRCHTYPITAMHTPDRTHASHAWYGSRDEAGMAEKTHHPCGPQIFRESPTHPRPGLGMVNAGEEVIL